jgi:tellurite resistance protein TerC
MFLVLLLVETSDVMFAFDSIPAIMGITLDPFIIFTSNVFAILGLRSLYFAIARLHQKFHYLQFGLGAILTFVGVKMLIADFIVKIPVWLALSVVLWVLVLSIVASAIWPPKEENNTEEVSNRTEEASESAAQS